jgi:N-acetylglutamate synthase-like GNAT family acetyltransferase
MRVIEKNGVGEFERNGFVISADKTRLEVQTIHDFLKNSYWAKNIPLTVVEKSIEHSLCFGVYAGNRQIGFARVISDYATMAYLADVFILEAYRGRGLSKWLMECIMKHPQLRGLRRFFLATRDAHGLYAQFGFRPLQAPEFLMEIQNLDIC